MASMDAGGYVPVGQAGAGQARVGLGGAALSGAALSGAALPDLTLPDTMPTEVVEPAPKTSRAGRNLPAAIAVGLGLLAVLGLTLAFRPEPFVVLVAIAISAGLWELRAALQHAKLELPVWPLLGGTVAMVAGAFLGGSPAVL
ncbi:MAG: hypothetical protein LBB58_03730, partial [Cellulomonadaceae bacterium]|nr:hypothetical protein [Cellulomonadaceae bacterium]